MIMYIIFPSNLGVIKVFEGMSFWGFRLRGGAFSQDCVQPDILPRKFYPSALHPVCIQIHLIDQIIKKAVCHDLLVFLNEFRCVSDGSCCHLDNLRIIKIISFRNASFLPMSLAIKPTRRAAITVPSLIPASLSVAIFPWYKSRQWNYHLVSKHAIFHEMLFACPEMHENHSYWQRYLKA